MSQKYNVDNLTSRFIKALLWDTYVPTVDIWRPGKDIIQGFTYVTFDKYIVVAKKDYKKGYGKGPQSYADSEYFEIIQPYVDGEFYRGVTSNFQSNSSLYDPNTHYMLGQYLRKLRDIYSLDLMPYYNCYSGEVSNTIRIQSSNNIDKVITNNDMNDGLLTYLVPIKLNKYYTIYYNSNIPFKVKPVFYDNVKITEIPKGSSSEYVQSTQVISCSLSNPYVFQPLSYMGSDFITTYVKARLLEDYLVLLIQVPDNGSPIIVLEGDYSGAKYNIIEDTYTTPKVYLNNLETLSDETLNQALVSFPSLCFNARETYAFSDRLLEYLLYSPITKNDKIRDNIKRVQVYLSSNKAENTLGSRYGYPYIKDVWDNSLRYFIYNLVTQQEKNPLFLDINGFVDKDSERIIDRAKISKLIVNDKGKEVWDV